MKELVDCLKSEKVMVEGEESFIGMFCCNKSFIGYCFISVNR